MVLDLSALCLGMLALACAVWAGSRSVPARFEKRANEARDLADQALDEWRRYKLTLDAWLEEAEGVLASVERKRRRLAGHAAADKASNGEGDPLNFDSPAHMREYYERRARQRGLL